MKYQISTKNAKTSHQTVGCFMMRHALHIVHRFMNSLFCRNWSHTDGRKEILENGTVYNITAVNNPNSGRFFRIILRLSIPEFVILATIIRQKVIMGALLDDAAIMEDGDFVAELTA